VSGGQVVEVRAYSNISTVSPVVLTIDNHTMEGDIAAVADVFIKSKSSFLVVSNQPSIFKLIGKDQRGRQFNTLDGGKVKWTFDNNLLERIAIGDSPYRYKHRFWEYEDILVVRPKEEGQLSLTATMECTGVSATIALYVIRPIRFESQFIQIKPGETINARLFKGFQRIKNGVRVIDIDYRLQVTPENSPEIEWRTDGSDAAIFSASTLSIRGIKTGTIIIRATHSRFPVECNAILTVNVVSSFGNGKQDEASQNL
jgi:hypothetical protein